jgi:hypothetical protein
MVINIHVAIIVIIIIFYLSYFNKGNVVGGGNDLARTELTSITETYLKKYFKIYYDNIMINLHEYLNCKNIEDMFLHKNLPNYIYWDDEFKNVNTKKEHPGQIKLLLVEMMFLAKYYDMKPDLVVYVGAGPGTHLIKLMELFPGLKFHFWDCRFDERLKKRVSDQYKLFERYFEQGDCAQYIVKKILFMSDIRSLNMSDVGNAEQNKILIENQQMQWDWIREIKPMVSMLKFRLPFENKSIEYKYCDGEIFIQPYTSPWSAESRLIVTNPDKIRLYNNYDYENKFVFLNYIIKICLMFRYKEDNKLVGFNELYMYWILELYYSCVLRNKNISAKIITNFVKEINKSVYKEAKCDNKKKQY